MPASGELVQEAKETEMVNKIFFFGLVFGGFISIVNAAPDQVSETYQDWVVQCVVRSDIPPCQAVQVAFQSQTRAPVMRVSIAYFARKEKPIGIEFWISHDILIAEGLLLEVDGKAVELEDVRFTRCDSSGCFATGILDDKQIKPLQDGQKVVLAVLSGQGEPRIMSISLKGFTEALGRVKQQNTAWMQTHTDKK